MANTINIFWFGQTQVSNGTLTNIFISSDLKTLKAFTDNIASLKPAGTPSGDMYNIAVTIGSEVIFNAKNNASTYTVPIANIDITKLNALVLEINTKLGSKFQI